MPKNEKKSKPWLWTVLAVINVVGIAFPLSHYLQNAGAEQIFGAVVLACAVLFLLILDGISVLLANFNINQL